MSIIPLDLQRKLERRWAARFRRPLAPSVPQPLPENPTTDRSDRGTTEAVLLALASGPSEGSRPEAPGQLLCRGFAPMTPGMGARRTP
jgi:hypothetical protein